MEKLKKLFGSTKLGWLRLVLFSVACAVVTAVFLILPFTKNTSLANMGVTLEFWVLAAIFVAVNCEKPLEAGLKTCAFFLISQPLIYLLQVPFSWMGWALFRYYPRWFVWTLLCFPGGMIAWRVKKGDLLSGCILGVATGFLAYSAVYFAEQMALVFPKHLLSLVFCAVTTIGLPLLLLQEKKPRIAADAVTVVIGAALWFAGA